MRSILVGEVKTGRRIAQIPVSGASWNVQHRGTGSISIDVPLDAGEFQVLERTWVGGLFFGDGTVVSPETVPVASTPVWRPGDGLRPEFLAALEPTRCFLAVLEDDLVIEAGPIWAWDYQHDSGVLRVQAAGLRSLFDHRIVMGTLASGWAAWSVTYDALSLGTIAKRLVQLAMSHTGGVLPIVLPDDEVGPNDDEHTRTYRGSEMSTVLTRLDQLMDVDGGPDIAFEPRLTQDRLGVEWVMRVGTEAKPMLYQNGEDWVWDVRVADGSVVGLDVNRDASQVAVRSWVTGGGQDEALLIGRREPADIGEADRRDAGYPLLENVESRPSVELQATVNSWAAGNLRATLRPMQTWGMTVSARPVDRFGSPAGPQLGQFRPGDWAKVWVPEDHPLLSLLGRGGFQRARIVGFSGGLDETVNVNLAPVLEAR